LNLARKTQVLIRWSYLSANSCKNITDSGLCGLGESLETLDSLQNLRLNFESCDKLTDYGFKALGQSLKRMSSLQNLYLSFEYCSITNKAAKILNKNLEKLSHLQCFNLYHWQNPTMDADSDSDSDSDSDLSVESEDDNSNDQIEEEDDDSKTD